MDNDDKKEDISDKRVVDTLFGPVEENDEPDYQEIIREEMPHYLFGGQYDCRQADLPLVRVPHYRPKVVEQDNLSSLIPYLDELALFEKRWGFEKKSGDRDGWCRWVKVQAVPVLEKLTELCGLHRLLRPRAVYSYFFCAARDNVLCLYEENRKDIFLEIEFPRLKNGVCLTDKLAAEGSGSFDTIAAVAVNMGREAAETAKSWLNAGKNADYGYLRGFALEMLNAMTEYTASLIAAEGCCFGEVFSLGSAKQGSAKVQSAMIERLDAALIDIAFSKNYLMMPEYSSLALVFPR